MEPLRATLALLLFALPTAAGIGTPAPDATPGPLIALDLGDSTFWDGPHVPAGGLGASRATAPVACSGATANMWTCAVLAVPPSAQVGSALCGRDDWCVEYSIDVLADGGTLRVAIDTPTNEDKFDITIVPPGGVRHAPRLVTAITGQSQGCGCYSMEARWPDAEAGRYVVQAHFYDVSEAAFRMRAALEAPVPVTADATPLLPNLRMVPPFDFAVMDCQAIETATHQARACLRFAAGPANVGAGPLDLRVRDTGLDGPQAQRIHHADGSYSEVPAGSFEYHAAHGHYHVRAMGSYELFRVDDADTGALSLARASPKVGFCMVDGLLADWASFDQDAQHSATGTCADGGGIVAPVALETAMDRPTFGITRGWADIYDLYTEGQFLDIDGLAPGHYVVRHTADPTGTVHESDETDNAAYALLHLEGAAVSVLERGHGTDPWDPAKAVADDLRRPLARLG